MVQLTVEEIHGVELGLLDEVHRFCVANGLRYYLAYGTLLGQVRHGGFIPWDDDADIWMQREDFERFLSLYEKHLDSCDDSRYGFVRPFSKDYGFAWGKIYDARTAYENRYRYMPDAYGLALDIFVLDEDHGERWYRSVCRRNSLRKLAWAHYRDGSADTVKMRAKMVAGKFAKIIPSYLYDERAISRLGRLGENSETGCYVELTTNEPYGRTAFSKSWFGKGRPAVFEDGHMFFVPDNPEEILNVCYGANWQTPVKSTHSSVRVFWRE